MKFAHIVNLGNFKLSDKYSDMHLLLYHWAKQSEKYNELCRNSKVYKIADNSQFELRREIDYDDYLKWAIRVRVDEIIAPDIMYNYFKTKKLIENFTPLVPKNMRIQGVVSGKNLGELVRSWSFLENNENIDVIGVGKRSYVEKGLSLHKSRLKLFKCLQPTKPIHFLGVSDIQDFFIEGVRSIDGKFLCKIANHNKKIDLFTRVDRKRLQVLFDLFETYQINLRKNEKRQKMYLSRLS